MRTVRYFPAGGKYRPSLVDLLTAALRDPNWIPDVVDEDAARWKYGIPSIFG